MMGALLAIAHQMDLTMIQFNLSILQAQIHLILHRFEQTGSICMAIRLHPYTIFHATDAISHALQAPPALGSLTSHPNARCDTDEEGGTMPNVPWGVGKVLQVMILWLLAYVLIGQASVLKMKQMLPHDPMPE